MTTLPTGLSGLQAFPIPVIPPATKPVREIDRRAGEGSSRQPVVDLPPKPKNARYQSLDLWRGVACLMLLLYHSTFYADLTFRVSQPASWSLAGLPLCLIRKCWVGVPIFFVISGYCIAASIDSLRRRPHSLWDYFVRRVRRIYPPLWIMCVLAVAFVAPISLFPTLHEQCAQLPQLSSLSLWNWLGNFVAAEAWRPNVIGGESNYLMPNTWTLCYEEQFYIVTGVLLAVAARRFFVAAALVTVGVFATRHILRSCGMDQGGFFWDGHWFMFATGILVYHALNYQTVKQRWCTFAALGVATIYGAADRILSRDPVQKHLSEYIAVAALFAGALIVMRRWDEFIVRQAWARPLSWCGKRSYSIYLTHYPLVVTVSCILGLGGLTSEFGVAAIVVPVCLLISLPIAWLFYVGVETRFLNAPAEGKS